MVAVSLKKKFVQEDARREPYTYVNAERHMHVIAGSPTLYKRVSEFESLSTRTLSAELRVKSTRRSMKPAGTVNKAIGCWSWPDLARLLALRSSLYS
mgnify:CR=1 FL=1